MQEGGNTLQVWRKEKGERRGEEGDEEDCGGKFGRRKKTKESASVRKARRESKVSAREREREWRLVGVSPCRSITPLLLLRHQLSLSFSLFLSFPCSFRFSTFTIYLIFNRMIKINQLPLNLT